MEKIPRTETKVIPSRTHPAGRIVAPFFQKSAAQPFFSATLIQPQLRIGPAKDRYEQEADRVAAQVVSDSTVEERPPISRIQRMGGSSAMAAPPHVSQEIERERGKGEALPPGIRDEMGNRLGADFTDVKVHTDSPSDTLNRSIQARAFTTGRDVFFRKGEYRLGSLDGQQLLAHELTHVVQQGGGGQAVQRMIALDVKPNVEMQEDMPALKVLAQLKKFLVEKLSDSQIYLLQAGLDFSQMKAKETLYIAGHGSPGELYGIKSEPLLRMLNDPKTGVPPHIEQIVFLVCNAGTPENESEPDSALISKVAMGLRHPGINVVGAQGYTFGAPSTAERGLNRVMPGPLWDVELGNDKGSIADVLGEMPMTSELKKGLEKAPEANPEKVETAAKVENAFDSRKQLKEFSNRFLTEKIRLEEKLKEKVNEKQPDQKGGMKEGVNSVVRGLKDDPGFGELVQQQNDLYDQFGFFYEKDAYTERKSLGQAEALKDPKAHLLFLNSISWTEKIKIAKELNSAKFDKEIGEDMEQRTKGVKERFKHASESLTVLMDDMKDLDEGFAVGQYERAGKEQLETFTKAFHAAYEIEQKISSLTADQLLEEGPWFRERAKPLSSLSRRLSEDKTYKGIATYLENNGQELLAKQFRTNQQPYKEAVVALISSLDATELETALIEFIVKNAGK